MKSPSYWAESLIKFSLLFVALICLIQTLAFKYPVLGLFAALSLLLLCLPFVAAVLISLKGKFKGLNILLPLVTIIEYPFLFLVLINILANEETSGENGWGVVFTVIIGTGLMLAAAILCYPLATYFQIRKNRGKPIDKRLLWLLPIGAALLIILSMSEVFS